MRAGPLKVREKTAPPADVLRALADNARQQLLQLLHSQELTVTELVEILRLPQSTVSRHLKTLRDADLIRDRRMGKVTFYSAAPASQDDDSLAALLMGWLKGNELALALRSRLDRVLRRRRESGIDFFERLGNRWDELRTQAFGETFPFEAMMSLLPSNWSVADIGAGTGYLLPPLARHFRTVIAVEPAEAMLACARQRVADEKLTNVDFRHGDLGKLPINDGACDLVLAMLVIHHVPEPAEALRELHRVVRPGGQVLIVEQRAHENQAFYDLMQDRWWGFDPAELAEQVRAAGFDNVQVRELQSAGKRNTTGESPALFLISGKTTGAL